MSHTVQTEPCCRAASTSIGDDARPSPVTRRPMTRLDTLPHQPGERSSGLHWHDQVLEAMVQWALDLAQCPHLMSDGDPAPRRARRLYAEI